MCARNVLFIISSIAVYLLFYILFQLFLNDSLQREYYEYYYYSIFIPFISAYILYTKRQFVSSKQRYCFKTGIGLILIAITSCICLINAVELSDNSYLTLMSLMTISLWIGIFIVCYGTDALSIAIIPFSFLICMIPIPTNIMEKAVSLLQTGSSDVAEGFFMLSNVPYTRDGFIFYLPTLYVEVAKQCSGINSTIALVISSLFAAFLFLQNGWKRIILVLSVIPITIFKNGLRIFVLSILGVYQNEKIFNGWLHRSGGMVFFVLALFLLWVVLRFLREKRITAPGGG